MEDYADNILDIACRENGEEVLFANGIHLKTKKLACWRFENGDEVCISNLALQQNLLRAFIGLSRLTGNDKYETKAKLAVKCYFDKYQHASGLLHWGGHRFVDYNRSHVVGIRDKKGAVHELKECFPYYELMFDVDRKAAREYVRAFWNAHMLKWPTLEINRHGYYENKETILWANNFESPKPFREVSGLSFMNAGDDLIFAAGELFKYTKENGALIWMTRMVRQYVKARNEETQLGAYQYNQAFKICEAPSDEDTQSKYGDRAFRQLGDDFKDEALEGKMILPDQALSIYYHCAVVWTKLGKSIGPFGKELIEYARSGMKAFAKYAYKEECNEFIPLLSNGVSLDGYVLKKDGYYGKKGQVLNRIKADERFLYSYVVVYCETQDEELWKIIRSIGLNLGFGDLGDKLGKHIEINENVASYSEQGALAAIELYKHLGNQAYLDLAIEIADNIISKRYIDKLFVKKHDSKYADFDSACPLAFLEICAAIGNSKVILPEYMTGEAYIHGRYKLNDGIVKSFTTKEMFQ